MKQNLLKYGVMIVLAMIASTGLLWADKLKGEDTSKIDSAKVESISNNTITSDSFKSDTINNPELLLTQDMDNKKDSISPEGINNSNAQDKKESYVYDLLALLILAFICSVVLYFITKWLVKSEKKNTENSKKAKDKKGKFAKWVDDVTHSLSSNTSIFGYLIAVFIFIIGVSILVFVCIQIVHFCCSDCMSSLTLNNFGLLGDFFGGLIGTFVAAIVAIYAIRTYKSERELQKEASVSAMLSTMLDLHKKNVEDIKITKLGTENSVVKGRDAFEQMYDELREIYGYVIESIQGEVESDRQKYVDWIDETKQKRLSHILSYGYFFYRVDSYMIPKPDDDAVLYDLCEKAAGSVPENLRELNRHVVLGHYYRHLYNMVNFIDKNEYSDNYKKKEPFVKLIRSQLSDYEQILLYYDTLSLLGKDWNEPLGKEEILEMNMICKYRLIKNCPNYMYYFGLKPSDVYAKEKAVWDNKKEYFFETDSKGQQEALKEMLK